MKNEKSLENEISGYIATLLRQNFGKGPTSVYVILTRPYLAIHFRGFIAPMERILLNKHEKQRILETRDLLMNDLASEITLQLYKLTGLDIDSIYADWNLDKETGMIFAVLNEKHDEALDYWPQDVKEKEFYKAIDIASQKSEKIPEKTGIYWLSERTILVVREQILVPIEKELIANGYTEELKLAKRPLEKRVIGEVNLPSSGVRLIDETFVDWNFDKDIGFFLFVLKPK
ncbi:DUF2294 domain-containing protein [Planococcus halotolerans]|uniref:Na+-translocating membrane potential-generating system MpsC domain-containing protein n=1 Tax=Planococcus halotolerans TaxID=2233542 RepID=A0A365L0J4_9BACL|nr:Na-translocating system protein MpsC family protein [Planococcus halotolerans]QHJ71290.1 DUF2294 family protein [Planococcus halotolerans]RAZ78948.1 hypothetical protein DP120_04845 [Planococcus halotolerans]